MRAWRQPGPGGAQAVPRGPGPSKAPHPCPARANKHPPGIIHPEAWSAGLGSQAFVAKVLWPQHLAQWHLPFEDHVQRHWGWHGVPRPRVTIRASGG